MNEFFCFFKRNGLYLLLIITFGVVGVTAYNFTKIKNYQNELNFANNQNLNSDYYSTEPQEATQTPVANPIDKTLPEQIKNKSTNNEQVYIYLPKETGNISDKTTVKPNTGSAIKSTSTQPVEKKVLTFSMPIIGEVSVPNAIDKLIFSNTLQEWITHPGIDILAEKIGTQVKATEEGEVVDIKDDPRYGRTIIIKHNSEYKSVYSNLNDSVNVKLKQKVKKGQVIGTIGNTAVFESEDKPHLHFEILKTDKNIDPMSVLKK